MIVSLSVHLDVVAVTSKENIPLSTSTQQPENTQDKRESRHIK